MGRSLIARLALAGLLLVMLLILVPTNVLAPFIAQPSYALGRGLVFRVAWSPGGETLALTSVRGLWQCTARLSDCRLWSERGEVFSVAYRPDGHEIATGSRQGEVYTWDAASGTVLAKWDGPTGMVRGLAYSPDGRMLAAGGEDGAIYLWAADGSPRVLRAHMGAVTGLAFNRDGTLLASSSRDGTAEVWDVATGTPGPALVGPEWGAEINAVAWGPDGDRLVAADFHGRVFVWDRQGALQSVWQPGPSPSYSVDWSADGRWIAAASYDGTVRVWDAAEGTLARVLQPETGRLAVLCARFDPEGKRLAVAVLDGPVAVWPLDASQAEATWDDVASLSTALALSPDGHTAAVGTSLGWVSLWDLDASGPSETWFAQEAHAGWVTTLLFSPDGHWLISTSPGDTTRVWDARTGALVGSLDYRLGQGERFDAAAFSPDGRWLYTAIAGNGTYYGGGPARIVRWRFYSGTDLRHEGEWDVTDSLYPVVLSRRGDSGYPLPKPLVVSPDGAYVMTGNSGWADHYTMDFWDPLQGRLVEEVQDYPLSLITTFARALSPDGHWIALAQSDATVHLLDTQDRFWRGPALSGHQATVGVLAFRRDGAVLASGDIAGNVRLWETASGRALGELAAPAGAVHGLAFTPDGSRLVAVTAAGVLYVWSAPGSLPALPAQSPPAAALAWKIPLPPARAWSLQPLALTLVGGQSGGLQRVTPDLQGGAHAMDVGDGVLVAGGGSGRTALYHRLADDETNWQWVDSQAYRPAWTVSVVNAQEFWTGGMSGTLVHFKGETWEPVELPSPSFVWDIEMLSADGGWAVGENGRVWHDQGGQWQAVTVPTTRTLYALDFTGPHDAWAAGRDGTLLHYTGGTWQLAPSPTGEHLRGLDMVSRDLGWAVGAAGTILRYDGRSWQRVSSPVDENLHAVSAPSAGVAWAVGMKGVMVGYDGQAWTEGPRFTDEALWTVRMVSPGEGWVIADYTLLHYRDGQWQPLTAPHFYVRAAAMAAEGGWAFGPFDSAETASPALRFVNGAWQPAADVPFEVNAVALAGTEAWAISRDRIYHWDGARWDLQGTSPCSPLYALQMVDARSGWAAGRGCTLRYRDGVWEPDALPAGWSVYKLSLIDAEHGWAAGYVDGSARLFQLDAGRWESVDSPITDLPAGLAMASENEGWVASGVYMYHLSQGQWRKEGLGPDSQQFSRIADLEMQSASIGWALGTRGQVYRYEGRQWQEVVDLGDSGVRYIFPLASGDVWVMGAATDALWRMGATHSNVP